jgi:hypothetical protein
MSKILADLSRRTQEPSGDAWFLRLPNELVHGPVSLERLCAWSREGRIAPASEISNDRINWTPATELPELELHWTAELKSGGTYGPFHRDAVATLVERGQIDADGVLTNTRTGEQAKTSDLLATPEPAPAPKPEPRPPAPPRQSVPVPPRISPVRTSAVRTSSRPALKTNTPELLRQVAALAREAQDRARALHVARRALAGEQSMRTRIEAREAEREEGLRERIAALRRDAIEAEKRIISARRELEQQRTAMR